MTASIEDLLSPISEALKADGYETTLSVGSSTISIAIEATASACAECLSPPEVLEPLIKDLLASGGRTERLELVYPSAWKGPSH
jgi:hypothetical protein